ncbi:hypothetical protein ABIE67_009850 [Streptomyces sp. V4I8]
MPENGIPSAENAGGLLVAARRIAAARGRFEQESDGGSTGVSDSND